MSEPFAATRTGRTRTRACRSACMLALALLLPAATACAQDNYEIQVYGSDLVPTGLTMIELHSNFTFDGSTGIERGVLSTNHALHETLEITHGFSDWFEVGFYLFTSARNGTGWQWVGDHIRPRAAIPESWHWPVGISLSQEIGYQRSAYSPDTWTWEIRPIIDQRLGRSLRGANAPRGFEFSPNAQVTFDFSRTITCALEYYGAYGPLSGFDPLARTEQQIFPSINVNFGPRWEFNTGVGFGLANATDRLIVKTILGYRLGSDEKGVAGDNSRRWSLPVTSYQLPATSYQLPATSYQLPATSYQLPATSYQPPARNPGGSSHVERE